MKMKTKANDTAIRALEVLKLLSFEELTQDEIINHIFKTKKSDYELRTDSLYKYLNTFKLLGINISKSKNKYSISNIPFKTDFTEKELETIKFLYSYIQEVCSNDAKEQLKKLFDNLLKNTSTSNLLNENIDTKSYLKRLEIKINKENVQKFCTLCKEKQRISFTYFNRALNTKQAFTVEPNEVIIMPTGEILKAFNPEIAEIQNFQIEDITDLKQLPIMAKTINIKNSVTFIIKGRLALAYELKNGERIIKSDEDYIVVSNSEEDKDELIKRLLRYGFSCEILYPKTLKARFVQILKNIKNLYD